MSTFTQAAYLLGHIRTDDHLFYNRIAQPYATTTEDLANTLGGSYPAVSGGSRIASNVLAKNPLMTRPTVAGMRYFGQNQVHKVCMDAPIARRIGQFPTPQHGSGMNFHDFNTNPNFRGQVSVASATGTLLYGPQFKNVAGASTLLSGGLANILVTALTDILSNSLPSQLQSGVSGLSTIVSALSGGGSVTDVLRLFSTFSFSAGPASLISSSIIGAVTSSLSGAPLSSVATQANGILTSSLSVTGTLSALSPAQSLLSINGGALLQNSLDQAINNAIPNASMIISSTFSSITDICSVSGSSPTETVNFADSGSAVDYSHAAAQSFANGTEPPFSKDTLSQGFTMSKEVSDYINKRNAGAA